MADYDFCIYADRSTLREPSSTEYRIQKTLQPKDVKPSLKVCEDTLNSDGVLSVFKNFDSLFSLIELMEYIDYRDLHFAFEEIIIKNLKIIGSLFSSYGNVEDIASDLRHQLPNIIKMSIYLFAEFVESFNTKLNTDYKILLIETKGSNKRQDMVQKHAKDYDWNLDEKLCSGFLAINSIVVNNITEFYDPPSIDRVLVSYLADCCYTQLEDPSIGFVRSKPLRDSIMQILIVLITNYDYGPNFKVKVVELLKLYEHLSIPFAKTVVQILKSGHNWSSLLKLIIKQIGNSGFKEGFKDLNNQNVSGGKSICAFLVEIAKHYPRILLSNVEHLLQCLDSDPYSLRICVLSVLKELLVSVLNNDELSDEEKKMRDQYILILKDHLFDINAFVRSKVLKLLAALVSCNSLPICMYGMILDLAEEKLHDKSAYVVRDAIQLIKSLIKLNPYSYDFSEGAHLSLIEHDKELYKEIEKILANRNISKTLKKNWNSIKTHLKTFLSNTLKSNNLESFDDPQIIINMDLPDVIMIIKENLTQYKFNEALKLVLQGKEIFKDEQLFKLQNEENLPEQLYLLFRNVFFTENIIIKEVSSNENNFYLMTDEQLNDKMISIKSKIKFLQEYDQYSNAMQKALNSVRHLLFGELESASVEAVDLFTIAHEFRVLHAQEGINSMLELIKSTKKNVKEALVNSYKKIYLTVKGDAASEQSVTIMTRLLNLLKTLSADSRKSFKILLNEWIKSEMLDDECINVLWSWFTKTTVINHEDRVAATLLLSLIASAKPSIVKSNVDSLVQFGFCSDYEMFIYTCQMLTLIEKDNEFLRYPEHFTVINQTLKITEKCFQESDVKLFNCVAASAISVIYKLAVKPDTVCHKLIKNLYNYIVIVSHGKDHSDVHDVDSNLAAKCIFVVAQVAFDHSEYLENYVTKELVQVVKSKYEVKKSKMKGNAEVDLYDIEAAEIDRINNKVQKICNKQLVTGSVMLSFFKEDIINACNSNNLSLKANGCLALVKFMMVSNQFCEKHVPLFIKLLETSDNEFITVDLIIGFDWLVFKHPNLLEPVTDKLYAKLDDSCTLVRYNALMIIMHLLNQQIIKVKGQVAGIAKLIVDKDDRIRYNAKQFFDIISLKGNYLYNVISDIISVLSNPENIVPENDFMIIMKFLLPFIKKDRQVESLVDKLCLRLKESTNDIQAYYLSYCLVVIKYTEKSLTKLSENISRYSDKLKNPKVYNNFNQIISNNSRLAKPLIKEILSELTSKIEQIVQDEDFTVQLSQKTLRKHLTTAKKKRPTSAIKETNSDDEMKHLPVTKQNINLRSRVKRKLIVADSEEEQSNEEFVASVDNTQNSIQNVKSNHESHIDVAVVIQNTTKRNGKKRNETKRNGKDSSKTKKKLRTNS